MEEKTISLVIDKQCQKMLVSQGLESGVPLSVSSSKVLEYITACWRAWHGSGVRHGFKSWLGYGVGHVGMLFHVIVITQRNSILKFYNILQESSNTN